MAFKRVLGLGSEDATITQNGVKSKKEKQSHDGRAIEQSHAFSY
jgi:hypothetical protein